MMQIEREAILRVNARELAVLHRCLMLGAQYGDQDAVALLAYFNAGSPAQAQFSPQFMAPAVGATGQATEIIRGSAPVAPVNRAALEAEARRIGAAWGHVAPAGHEGADTR